MSRLAATLVTIVNGTVRWLAWHWLFVANAVLAVLTGLPIAAPVLMAAKLSSAARVIYLLFRPLCHQLPERSFFLFGPQATYTLAELQRLLGPDVPLRFAGDASVGYTTALCQRDLATYGAMLLGGLGFALVRDRLRALPLGAFVLLCLPIAVDGLGQLFGLWRSTWWSRSVTGATFGLAVVWLAYPNLESGMRSVRRVLDVEDVAEP